MRRACKALPPLHPCKATSRFSRAFELSFSSIEDDVSRETLTLLEPCEPLYERGELDLIGCPAQVPAARVQQLDDHLHVVRLEVIEALLEALQDCLGRTDPELGELAQEPDVAELGLDLDDIAVLVHLGELVLEHLDKLRAHVAEVLRDLGCEASVEGDALARHIEEDLGHPLAPAFA